MSEETFMGEPVLTRWKPLNRDYSRLRIHQSMHDRSFGNPGDDKLMLEWLWEHGYALCKRVPDDPLNRRAQPEPAAIAQVAALNELTSEQERLGLYEKTEPAASADTVLPDGSAFATASFPLPKDHWLYAPRGEWDSARDEYAECPAPILTNAQKVAVIAAARYAIRGATMCGQEQDFDPDAMVQNIVYALCGPATGSVLPADAAPSVAPEPLKGWKLNHVQFVRGSGKAEIGYLDSEDDRFSPIVTVDTGLYYEPDQAYPLAVAILGALQAAHPPREASVAPEPLGWYYMTRGSDGLLIGHVRDRRPRGEHILDLTPLFAAHPPRAPLTEGALMGIYMEFDRHADKAWTPTEYLLRFAAAVDAHGIRRQG